MLWSQGIPATPTSPTKPNILYSKSQFTVSLKNPHDGGKWQFSPKNNVNIQVISKRYGQIYSYFNIKIQNDFKGNLTFNYKKKDQSLLTRQFTVSPSPENADSKNTPLLFGDVPKTAQENSLLDTPISKETDKKDASPSSNNVAKKIKPPQKNKKTKKHLKSFSKIPLTPTLHPQKKVKPHPEKTLAPMTPQQQQLIMLLINSKSYKEASKRLEPYVNQDNTHYNWITETNIRLKLKIKNYQDTLKYIDLIVNNNKNLSPDSLMSLYNKKSIAEEKLGKIESAKTSLLYLLNLFPDNPETYYLLGNFYLNHNQPDQASAIFKKLIVLFPDFKNQDEVYFKLAEYYKNLKNLEGLKQAVDLYSQVISIGINSPYYLRAVKIKKFLEENFLHPY